MIVALKEVRDTRHPVKSESERLKELKEEAAEIRRKHESGALTSKEAARELVRLKTRYRSLLDLLF